MPIWPAAPARVSTTKGWPKAAAMPSATVRARKSAAPPGANVLTMRTGFVGHACVQPGAGNAMDIMAMNAAAARVILAPSGVFMSDQSGLGDAHLSLPVRALDIVRHKGPDFRPQHHRLAHLSIRFRARRI